MASVQEWREEYWLPLLQLFLEKPVGVKPLYSKGLVGLSLRLHIEPQNLYERMFALRNRTDSSVKQLWKRYGRNHKRLAHDVERASQMEGFGHPANFYEGVEVSESFEKMFRPISGYPDLMPVSLVMILDLYFRLIPNTMVAETPEVRELAKLLGVAPALVAEVMDVFCFIDPYLNRADMMISRLLEPCQMVWNQYGNGSPQQLSATAAQLRDYFKK